MTAFTRRKLNTINAKMGKRVTEIIRKRIIDNLLDSIILDILHIANMKRPVSDKTRKKIAKLLQEFHSDRFADSEKTLVTIFKCLHLDTRKIARPYTIDK